MPRTIRYHLDEHCPNALAEGLRRRGIDVVTTAEVNLLSASDEEHLSFALAHERVVFTEDDDFLRLHARGLRHSGIIFCKANTQSLGELIAALALIWEVYDAAELKGNVEFI